MKQFMTLSLIPLMISFSLCAKAPAQLAPTGAPPPERARVVDAYGTATVTAMDSHTSNAVNIGDLIGPKVTLKTGDGSAVLLMLPEKYMFRIGERTTVEIKQLGANKQFSFNLIGGKVWNIVRGLSKPAKYEVETSSAVAGVSGTVFSVFHDELTNETQVSTSDGSVNVLQGTGPRVAIAKGFMGRFIRGGVRGQASQMQPPMFKMWKHLMMQEGLLNRNRAPRLDRQFDPMMRQWMPGRGLMNGERRGGTQAEPGIPNVKRNHKGVGPRGGSSTGHLENVDRKSRHIPQPTDRRD